MSITEQIATARRDALNAGKRPDAVGLNGEHVKALGGLGIGIACYLGMRIRFEDVARPTVYALPGRKIGRYEVVAPTAFEAAA